MPTINLPEYPKGTEFEEFISAYLQCSGRFIERNLHERAPDDVCELDIALTEQAEDGLGVTIVEVKSGDWKLHELFTLSGKMHYLGVQKAALVALGTPAKADVLGAVAKKVDIDLAFVDTHEQAEDALSGLVDVECSEPDIEIWRYSYWLERVLVEQLRKLRKSNDGRTGPKVVWDYYQALQTNLFQRDMLTRTRSLYELFSDQPHMAAKWSAESLGGNWDEAHSKVLPTVFNEVYYTAGVHELNMVTYVEQKTRLAILKNLVDYELFRRSHTPEEIDALQITFLGQTLHFIQLLPTSFRDALDTLSGRPYFHRYAVLWQWFLWVFGGFILLDYEDEEYEQLGRVAGVPAEVVPQALEAFDVLFPTDTGWFRDLGDNSHVRLLQLTPVPFFGIGANYRRYLYSKDESYEGLELKGTWTKSDLGRWNNSAVAYLAEDL